MIKRIIPMALLVGCCVGLSLMILLLNLINSQEDEISTHRELWRPAKRHAFYEDNKTGIKPRPKKPVEVQAIINMDGFGMTGMTLATQTTEYFYREGFEFMNEAFRAGEEISFVCNGEVVAKCRRRGQ